MLNAKERAAWVQTDIPASLDPFISFTVVTEQLDTVKDMSRLVERKNNIPGEEGNTEAALKCEIKQV